MRDNPRNDAHVWDLFARWLDAAALLGWPPSVLVKAVNDLCEQSVLSLAQGPDGEDRLVLQRTLRRLPPKRA